MLQAATSVAELPLLAQRPFRMLTFSRFSSRVAQNALNFALVLLVVDETGRAFFSSLLVLTLVVPATAAGLVAGTLSDMLPKRWLIVAGNLLRAAVCVYFARTGAGLVGYYGFALLLALTTPVSSAAEAATLPMVVERTRLARANAIGQAVVGVAQLVGFGVVTPVMLRAFDSSRALFVVAGGLFVIAAVYGLLIGRIRPVNPVEVGGRVDGPWYTVGWRQIRSEPKTWHAAVELTLISTSLIILGGLIPRYIEEVLDLPVDVGVVVLAPGAFGVAAGLRVAAFLAHRIPHSVMSSAGFVAYVVLLGLLAFVNPVAQFLGGFSALGWLNDVHLKDFDSGGVLAMITVVPLGFAFAIVSVSAQTVLNDVVPLHLQGRVQATQSVMAALASSVPVIVAGVMSDLVGVIPVMALVAALTGAAAVGNLRSR